MKNPVLPIILAAAGLGPVGAYAESNVQTGSGTSSPGATAHVDFQITIPKILYLRVGTGSNYSAGTLTGNAAVDQVAFAPAAGAIGNGTAVAGTGGDLSGGVETAAIVSNSGNVTLNATTTGALNDGGSDTISFAQVSTTASTLNSATPLPAPTLTNGVSANIVLTAPATKVINQDAKWTYAYANTAVPPAGIYGGVNVNNSRVTYTATMP